jgi:hypothetical protein
VSELHVAEALGFRLAQQEHWRQAAAVGDGRQLRIDPDGAELEQLGDRVRIYRLHEAYGRIDGHAAILTQRLVKRLTPDGAWESELVVDSYQHIGGAPGAAVDDPGTAGSRSPGFGVAP